MSPLRLVAYGVMVSASCAQPASSPSVNQVSPSQEGYVEAPDGAQIFYRILGSGADTVIVLHGGPGFTMDYFYSDLAPLADGRALLFYDQRGAGKSTLVSDSAALTAQRFVADLEAVRSYFGMDDVVLVGHSWGAGVAALYAQRHPERVRRMVIVGGLPLQRAILTQGFEAMAAARDTVSRRRMRERREALLADRGNAQACREYYVLWFTPFFADTQAMSRSKGDFCAGTPEALRNTMHVDRYTAASLGDWDWRVSLREVRAPTLVIHGTVDPLPLEGAHGWGRTLPNARVLELNGIGHFPYLEAPGLFFSAADQFLRGEWPPAARVIPRE
jgi:proline iminopeptidase